MRSEKLHGFVLKRSNVGEADKILTVFTPSRGKIKILAKGIRKIKSRRAAHVELFNTCELMVHDSRGFPIATEARTLATLEPDLKSAGLLFYISEVLDRLLPEDQPHPEIYFSLQKSLLEVSEHQTKKFVVETLWNLGFLPKGEYPSEGVSAFVETIIERPIKSRKFLEEI